MTSIIYRKAWYRDTPRTTQERYETMEASLWSTRGAERAVAVIEAAIREKGNHARCT